MITEAGSCRKSGSKYVRQRKSKKKRLNKKRSTMFSCKYITENDNDDTTETETKIRAILERSGGGDKGA